MKLQSICFATCLLGAGASSCIAAGERVVLPIEQHVFREAILYSVKLTVAGAPTDLIIDSGSTGVRVLSAALPSSFDPSGGVSVQEGYANGVRLAGQRTNATIGVGSLSANVGIEDIESASCAPNIPKCLVSKDSKGFFHDLDGIVGMSLSAPGAARPVPNPIQSVASAWIIELPEPGSKAPGQLILNPSPDDLKGFTRFPAGTGSDVGAGRDNPVPACIKNEGTGRSFCGPLVLDTGKPSITVITHEFKDTRYWTAGSRADLTLGEGPTALTAKFTVKPSLVPTQVFLGPFPNFEQPAPRILAGDETFLLFDVLFDTANEQVGLRRR